MFSVFSWYVSYMCCEKKDTIIKTVKSIYWPKAHKFGISCIPKSMKDTVELDDKNGDPSGGMLLPWNEECKACFMQPADGDHHLG